MELVCKINCFDDIEKLTNADAYLLASKSFSIRFFHEFSLDEIRKAKTLCRKLNKKIYVLVNKIIFEDELDKLKKYLEKLKAIEVDKIYFADFSVFMLAKELKIEDKMVFYHETFIRNSLDVNTYSQMGIKTLICSKDMNIESVRKLTNKENLGIQVFGYTLIYYTKREIVKNHLKIEKINLNYEDNFNLYLKENTREEKYRILEQNHQSTIFNSKVLCYIDSFDELTKYLNYFIFDCLFFDASYINEVIDAFINHKKIDLDYTDLFLNKKVGLTK